MEKPIVFMFSGQGSQSFHMGRVLYESDPVFKTLMTRMDEIAGDYTGRSVVKGIYDPGKGRGDRFDDISLSHPALFMIQTAMARTLAERGIVPDAVVGTSLGEFVGAALYGMMEFETAFRIILRQTEVFRGDLEPGGMIAVMDSPDIYYKTPVLRDNCEISAINFDTHFVVSAPGKSLEIVRNHLLGSGISHFALPVTYAFHSSHLDRIQDKFISLYKGLEFHPPDLAVHSCAEAGGITRIDPEYFWRVVRYPIRFKETFTGLASKRPCIFVDLGPSGTLATFARYNLPKGSRSEILPILTPFGGEQENLNRVLALSGKKRAGVQAPRKPSPKAVPRMIRGRDLGCPAFKKRFDLDYACLAGGMCQGISSASLVTRMGNAGMMGFFGTHGLPVEQVDQQISAIDRGLEKGRSFGLNLSAGSNEDRLVDLCLKREVSCVEVSGFVEVTPALVKYRAAGMGRAPDLPRNRIIAKLSRPEVAVHFLRPPSAQVLDQLVAAGEISPAQAGLAGKFPVADALCVSADCGGPTHRGTTATLLPVMIGLRDRIKKECRYDTDVFVGAAGGIGTPEAAASAFVLGADFILTGSVNQCTPEAGTSSRVKEMLARVNVQDTAYAPCSQGFEMGATVQVMSRGVFFPARANRLFTLYQTHDSLEEVPQTILETICQNYFDSRPEKIYEDCVSPGSTAGVELAGTTPKQRMALIFKWYLDNAVSKALAGQETDIVNYQVYCGPSLGAFNQWVAGTGLENWEARQVDLINKKIMGAAAALLTRRFHALARTDRAGPAMDAAPRENLHLAFEA